MWLASFHLTLASCYFVFGWRLQCLYIAPLEKVIFAHPWVAIRWVYGSVFVLVLKLLDLH